MKCENVLEIYRNMEFKNVLGIVLYRNIEFKNVLEIILSRPNQITFTKNS